MGAVAFWPCSSIIWEPWQIRMSWALHTRLAHNPTAPTPSTAHGSKVARRLLVPAPPAGRTRSSSGSNAWIAGPGPLWWSLS
ncbi:hypothetical protein AB656_00760 [Bifidobacterium actinocoloniiforme DSM 22766]|nr:hypothetical protein AB656_00760 [Bifidobacterium actinocoloniiforme DSM 22766]